MFTKTHHFLILLLFNLPTFSLSLAPIKRQTEPCVWPSTYTIYDLTTFHPFPTNYHPKSVFLNMKPSLTNDQKIQCYQFVDAAEDFWLVNCSQFPEFSYTWDGKTLYLKRYLYWCNAVTGDRAFVEAELVPDLSCYPSTGTLRRANGTTCQSPEEEISGDWVRGSEPGPSWPPWQSHFV